MKKILIALMSAVSLFPVSRAAAPVRSGVVVLDATQFLGELPDGDEGAPFVQVGSNAQLEFRGCWRSH